MKQLTDKQLRFVELYNGNASEAAKLAGYSHPRMAGKRCLKDEHICTLIAEKRSKELVDGIADRHKIQKRWSDMFFNDKLTPMEQLKASEHLAKSQGLFLDRVENSGEISLSIKWAE